ncbi:MAG: hypothetical protein ACXVH3_26050 [Solirubrobacteraceae bacterium]
MRLEKMWRNAVIEAVQAGGLDPRDFDFDFGDTETRIAHRWSESWFSLRGPWGDWDGSQVVGEGPLRPYQEYIWSKVEERVQQWATKVKSDLETPDLWAQLQREREILSWAPHEAENTPFTPDEQAEIVKHLDELMEYVKDTHSLAQDQTVVLDEGFKELVDALPHSGRNEWRLMFLGVVLTFIVAGILPPDAVHGFLWMALHGLQHFFGGGAGPAPPQLPPVT